MENKQGRKTVAFEKMVLSGFEEEAINLAMLNSSQSVALEAIRKLLKPFR